MPAAAGKLLSLRRACAQGIARRRITADAGLLLPEHLAAFRRVLEAIGRGPEEEAGGRRRSHHERDRARLVRRTEIEELVRVVRARREPHTEGSEGGEQYATRHIENGCDAAGRAIGRRIRCQWTGGRVPDCHQRAPGGAEQQRRQKRTRQVPDRAQSTPLVNDTEAACDMPWACAARISRPQNESTGSPTRCVRNCFDRAWRLRNGCGALPHVHQQRRHSAPPGRR